MGPVIRNQLQPRTRLPDQGAVYLVIQGRHQDIRRRHRLRQLGARHRRVTVAQRDIKQL